jgi:hypothetical protein
MEITNREVLTIVMVLDEISGVHSDKTELMILAVMRKLNPVAEDIQGRLRQIMREFSTINENGDTVWKDLISYQDREAAILELESGVKLEDLPKFTEKSFEKLPPAKQLVNLGPLFTLEADS